MTRLTMNTGNRICHAARSMNPHSESHPDSHCGGPYGGLLHILGVG